MFAARRQQIRAMFRTLRISKLDPTAKGPLRAHRCGRGPWWTARRRLCNCSAPRGRPTIREVPRARCRYRRPTGPVTPQGYLPLAVSLPFAPRFASRAPPEMCSQTEDEAREQIWATLPPPWSHIAAPRVCALPVPRCWPGPGVRVGGPERARRAPSLRCRRRCRCRQWQENEVTRKLWKKLRATHPGKVPRANPACSGVLQKLRKIRRALSPAAETWLMFGRMWLKSAKLGPKLVDLWSKMLCPSSAQIGQIRPKFGRCWPIWAEVGQCGPFGPKLAHAWPISHKLGPSLADASQSRPNFCPI